MALGLVAAMELSKMVAWPLQGFHAGHQMDYFQKAAKTKEIPKGGEEAVLEQLVPAEFKAFKRSEMPKLSHEKQRTEISFCLRHMALFVKK